MGGSGGPGKRKGGELGEQSFVYMGFKGAALDLTRGRAPRGIRPGCLPLGALSGLHPEPEASPIHVLAPGSHCPKAKDLPPGIPAPFLTFQDTVLKWVGRTRARVFSDPSLTNNPSSNRLVFLLMSLSPPKTAMDIAAKY